MTAPITLTLPLAPNLGNGRMHWRRKHQSKTMYLVECCCAAYDLPRPPAAPWEHARIALHVVLGNRSDVDNLFARAKWPLDWIVRSGYVVDDSPKHLTWAGIPTQEVSRKKPHSMTFTLTPL